MTHPPQPPGPYGRPEGGPYGHQPGRYGQPQPPQPAPYAHKPTAYQGLGSFSGGQQSTPPPPPPPSPPPRKRTPNKIIAVVVAAVLVLGGAGAAIFFLAKGGDENGGAGTAGAGNAPRTGSNDPKPDDGRPAGEPSAGNGSGSDSPAAVQEAYIQAYESKQFSDVVRGACAAYKEKFGTNTSDLEAQLQPFNIKATANGRPDVTGSTAVAKIDLELTKGTEIKRPKIKIKIIKEDGKWRFCGEGEG